MEGVLLPCHCYVDKAVIVKTTSNQLLFVDVDVQNKYNEYQHITRQEKMHGKLLTFEIARLTNNNSMIETFAFGYDAYRQVVEQLINSENSNWLLNLYVYILFDGDGSNPKHFKSNKINFVNMEHVSAYYVESFKRFERMAVEQHDKYDVLLFKICIFEKLPTCTIC